MSTVRQQLVVLTGQNDRDLAHAKEWLRGHSTDELMEFWSFLQTSFKDPKIEAMSWLAALKFSELVQDELTRMVGGAK